MPGPAEEPWEVEFTEEFEQNAKALCDKSGSFLGHVMAGAEYLLLQGPDKGTPVQGTNMYFLLAANFGPRVVIYYEISGRKVTVLDIHSSILKS